MTEKKIGLKLLLLFSMFFASFALSLLLFPVSSKAYLAPDNVNYDYYQNMGGNWEYYSNLPFCYIRNYTNNNETSYPMLTIVNIDNVNYVAKIQSISNSNNVTFSAYDTENHNFTSFSSDLVQIFYNGGTRSGNYNMTCQTANIDSDLFFVDYDSALHYLELASVGIDWDNPLYSPNIPVPNVSVSYRELTSVPTIDVPLNVSIPSFGDYYIQSFALFDQPTKIFVQKTYPGGYVYNTVNVFSAYHDLVQLQDQKFPGDYSLDSFHLLMNDAWYHSMIQDNAINFGFVSGLTTQMQDSAKNKYFTLRKNMCLAGNEIYLYFRYFTIMDNRVVVGPWRIWNSYNPNEYTDEVPAYYQPYNPAVGSSSTNTEVTPVSSSSPVPPDIYNPVSTGQNINIEVKQNVPNYPDYPTIASYNKDNLLVDTMNQLNSLNGFIGDFSDFLVATFVFIPSWIWTIIGVGFSLSIIVMFLKIL